MVEIRESFREVRSVKTLIDEQQLMVHGDMMGVGERQIYHESTGCC